MDNFPALCMTALNEGQPYPQFSVEHPEATLSDAYALQEEFLLLRDEDTVGYKAALTAAPAQQAMGLTEAIVGVLLESTAKDRANSISLNAGGILETELGYTLNQQITQPVTPDSVLGLVGAVSPMVEIAHPNLAARPTGADLIATNSATFGFLKGIDLKPTEQDLDSIATELRNEETALFSGLCGEVMEGQLSALCWLINTVLALGYPLEPGHILMTGSVGGVSPAVTGSFAAKFTQDGREVDQLEFTLKVA